MTTGSNVMRYVRYSEGGVTSPGILDGETIRQLEGDIIAGSRPTGRTVRLAGVTLEVPIDPTRVSKIIGLVGQFHAPGEEARKLKHLRTFAMLPTTLTRPEADVELPPECHHIHHEGELVVVIGREGRYIPVEAAAGYVFGVAAGNDIADQTWYSESAGGGGPSRLMGKSPDTWAPLGPYIAVGQDYSDLQMEVRLNGRVAIRARTSEMNHSVEETISYLSHYVTLWPGDLIYMGTPIPNPELREMKAGDVVEVEIEQLGVLRNRIVAMKDVIAGRWWPEEEKRLAAQSPS